MCLIQQSLNRFFSILRASVSLWLSFFHFCVRHKEYSRFRQKDRHHVQQLPYRQGRPECTRNDRNAEIENIMKMYHNQDIILRVFA